MRYVIGIDLGTTNSCVSYVDTENRKNPRLTIEQFRIPQPSPNNFIDYQLTLPSFTYLTPEHEAQKLPWQHTKPDYIVGKLAQSLGAKTPTRLVISAKSWLCNSSANRKERILPVDAADPSQRISPVEASARYLLHLREAWNHQMAKGDPLAEFDQQEIILTVPASFDEVARTLTAEAAKMAGIPKLTLLEEPQAAFYSWISQHEEVLKEQGMQEGETILVCDVGGGTTDFSLIEVQKSGDHLSFQRISIGDHLLLGGDNMDAAIAHYLEGKLGSPELSNTQWMQLLHQARAAKEHLLKEEATSESRYSVLLQGTGSNVVLGSLSIEVTQMELQQLLLSGFFASCEWAEAIKIKKAGGIRVMGLPYEDEPSIIKQMAHFLKQNSPGAVKKPDYILFNGGAMKPSSFQREIINALDLWFSGNSVKTLQTVSLDLAVSRGAAYYGKVRRGLGMRIGGGNARGYYLEVGAEDGQKRSALTLLPRGAQEGARYESQQTFWLTPNTPIAFRVYSSHVRLNDIQGSFVEIDPNEMQLLPPIHTVLRYGKKSLDAEKIPVHLAIEFTAIGTLAMGLKSENTDHQWSLEFQLRSPSGQDQLAGLEGKRTDETFDLKFLKEALEIIHKTFDSKALKPAKLMEHLEESLQIPRREWSPSLLRGMWEALLQEAPRRKASQELEARWWNMAGFLLRPGFGFPLDDFRMKELWKIILGDLKVVKTAECQLQSWICYRRLAGGLNKGQQLQLAAEILPTILKKSGLVEIKGKSELYLYAEKMRLLGAMEHLDVATKIRLGDALLRRLEKGEGAPCDYWTLGRLGARHLLYASLGSVVPIATCLVWIDQLLNLKNGDPEELAFVFSQLARKTDHRVLNLPQSAIDRLSMHFKDNERLKALITSESDLTESEQDHLFGDNLPSGLTL